MPAGAGGVLGLAQRRAVWGWLDAWMRCWWALA
jgi:hypothetical protein